MSTAIGFISVRRVSGRMPLPTCVSRSFEENSRERVRVSAPGCGPEFTSRTPSGWPGLGASCRPDESASAAEGGRRRRPQVSSDRVTPEPSRPERPPTPRLAARRVSPMPDQSKPPRSGDRPRCVTLLVVRRGRGTSWRSGYPDVRAPRRARSRVTRGVGRQWGDVVSAGCGVACGGQFGAALVTSITWAGPRPHACLCRVRSRSVAAQRSVSPGSSGSARRLL